MSTKIRTGLSLKKLELGLQGKVMEDLTNKGWFVTKTSDRFKAGRPDLRIAHRDFGQLDVELKYWAHTVSSDFIKEEETGMTKLQWLKMREMNRNGMPTICLIFVESLNWFFVTTLLRDTLPGAARRVLRELPPGIISGAKLFTTARSHLHDLGYRFP